MDTYALAVRIANGIGNNLRACGNDQQMLGISVDDEMSTVTALSNTSCATGDKRTWVIC